MYVHAQNCTSKPYFCAYTFTASSAACSGLWWKVVSARCCIWNCIKCCIYTITGEIVLLLDILHIIIHTQLIQLTNTVNY